VLWIAARCPPGRSPASPPTARRRLHRRPGPRREQSGAGRDEEAGADLSLPGPDTPPPQAGGGHGARGPEQL